MSDVKSGPTKITYATMTADQMEDLHRAMDQAAARVAADFGQSHPMIIDGHEVNGAGEFDDTSPIDTRILLGRFQKGTRDQVKDAIAAARKAFGQWCARPWEERVALVRKAGELLREERWTIAAIIQYEAGKNRLEAVGEVEEAAEFFEYYANHMEEANGFEAVMGLVGSPEESISVLRPYGVFAVISPFNFPLALAAGPAASALIAGNTVVFKPATDTPYTGFRLAQIFNRVLPAGVFNFVTGGGGTVGQELIENAGVDGIVFTGSMEVGMKLVRENGTRPIPRPLVIEMGGKNPTLVMTTADLEKASQGVMRSAFGTGGQKCSACSRVYVRREVRDRFVEMLVEKTRAIKVGNPIERDVWLGPLINEGAVKTYLDAVELARRDGGRMLTGGRRLTEEPFGHGYFVEPTIIDGLPKSHRLFKEELFVPIVVLTDVRDFDEAIDLANDTEYGLTAGIFSADEVEIARFFNEIQAGVTYANRQAGATTGAWPGINSFGGWKASGSTGRGTGGPHYLQQFLREQSRVRVR